MAIAPQSPQLPVPDAPFVLGTFSEAEPEREPDSEPASEPGAGSGAESGPGTAPGSGTESAPGARDDARRFPGIVVGDRVRDLGQALESAPRTLLDVLDLWDASLPALKRLAEVADGGAAEPDGGAGEWLPLAGLRTHAPVEPRQLFQSGANYRQHVIDLATAHRPPEDTRSEEEARAEIAEQMDRRAAEDLPYVFIGLPSSVTGPYDDVVLPAGCEQPDWELELAAVIGRPAHRVGVEEALGHVAGYTIANDLTDRAAVFRRDMPAIGTDWLRAKNAPGFTPLGPYLVPAEYVGDPGDLQVTLKVNGETMQDESTKDMIFGVARMISYISRTVRLLPGDLVLTGSPAGNGIHWGRLLRDGDVMEGTVTGLGTQRTRCVGEDA